MDLSFYQSILDQIAAAAAEGKRPAFAYDRVSDQANAGGISLEYQESHAAHYAAKSGLYIVHFFTVIESARKEGRKVFNQMIDLALKFDVRDIIFKNTDRMSRNYQDLMRIEELYEQHQFTIHFYQTFRTLNKKSTYADKFIMNVEIAAARQLSDKLSHDITENHKYRAGHGTAVHAPVGYTYSKDERRHVIDPGKENFMRYFFDTFDSGGLSLGDFTDILNRQGYTTDRGARWRKSSVYKLLINPFYHGEFTFGESVMPGSQDTFYDKQRYIKRLERITRGSSHIRTRKGMKTKDFLFSRFVKCGKCGKTLTGDLKKGKFIYYGHRCGNDRSLSYIPEDTLANLIEEQAAGIQFDASFGDLLKQLFSDVVDKNDNNQAPAIASLSRKINELEAEQNRIVKLYSKGTVPMEVLERNINQLQQQIEYLMNEKKALRLNKSQFIIDAAQVIDELLKFNALYNAGDRQDRADLLRTKAESVILEDGKVRFEWTKPYAFVLDDEIIKHKSAVGIRLVMHAKGDEIRTLQEAVKQVSEEWMLWLVA